MGDYALVIPIRVDMAAELDRHFGSLGGQTLVERKFDQVSKLSNHATIYVATASPLVRSQAEQRGFGLIDRPGSIESAPPGSGLGFHLTQLVEHVTRNVQESHIVWGSVTNPFFEASHYLASISSYESARRAGFDSLISVTEMRGYQRGDSGALNYQPGLNHAPLRMLDPLIFATTCVRVAARDSMREWGYFHGPNPFEAAYDRMASLEIRDELDLLIARAWIDATPVLR